ncbi:MAG: hypothetical protein U0936_04100 [Planctomycetaceae bacterium]
MDTRLQFEFLKQPDNTTCGPTCLHAVYSYYGDELPLQEVIDEVPVFADGGTLAVMLGCHALRRGYDARIFTFNLQVFDPTWFNPDGHLLEGLNVDDKLRAQMEAKPKEKLRVACETYIEFMKLGGKIRMEDLTGNLIRRYLKQSIPVLTGLSATYLYRERREIPATSTPDDIAGLPSGHFAVLCGYDSIERSVLVADPFHPNPLSTNYKYEVSLDRVVCSILLGILTYDANLLIVRPRER